MRASIHVRPLTDAERHALRGGLRSTAAFTLRRCQYLLASADGLTPAAVARFATLLVAAVVTPGRCRNTVLRAAPCLFGLYSVVALAYHTLPESGRTGGVRWPGKATVTFSDAPTSVRRRLWSDGLLPQAGGDGTLAEMPGRVRELLLTTLAPAA